MCIQFCLQLHGRSHIGVKEFKKLNWLSDFERFNQCQDQANTKSSVLKLKQPSTSTRSGKKTPQKTTVFERNTCSGKKLCCI